MSESAKRRLARLAQVPSAEEDADSHPFLTPRGLRLQQAGPLDDELLDDGAMRLAPGARDSDDRPFAEPDAADMEQGPEAAIVFPTAVDGDRDPDLEFMLQNIRPAKKYANPLRLRNRSLQALFQTSRVPQPLRDARRAIGKLLIELPNERPGTYAAGSAWILGGNTIATAAHNLFDSNTRQWSRRVAFCPNYDYYATDPRPSFTILSGAVPRAYFDNPLTNHDIAICRVDQNLGDDLDAEIPFKPIEDIAYFDDHAVTICGYPAASGFDFGKQLWHSRGDFLFGASGGGDDDFSPVLATDLGGGASGCPWLVRDPDDGRIVAVGVSSGHARLRYQSGEPNLMTLTSPLICPQVLERLNEDAVMHDFV